MSAPSPNWRGPTPVLLIDDHQVFADAVRFALDAQDDLACVGVAASVADAREVAATLTYGAAVVDLGLPDGDGSQLIGHLADCSPGATIIVLTAHPRSDLARRCLAAGAHAVLPKRGRLDDLFAALRDRPHPPAAATPASPLTGRERDVLQQLAGGADVRRIAGCLGLSIHTVRDHVRSLLSKLGARTQLEAVVTATRAGIVVLEPE